MMACYLLHFSANYYRARHYLGYTPREVEERLQDHLAGRGSPLVRAVVDAGYEITVAQVWPEGDRTFERQLKKRRNTPRTLCPICRAERQASKPSNGSCAGAQNASTMAQKAPKVLEPCQCLLGARGAA